MHRTVGYKCNIGHFNNFYLCADPTIPTSALKMYVTDKTHIQDNFINGVT